MPFSPFSILLFVLSCYVLEAFLVQDHDETLQMAFEAIQQLRVDNEQLKQRLQAAEAVITAHGQTLGSLPGSRMFDDFVWYGDWMLVFRATQGIGIHVYETYTNRGHNDDDPATRGLLPCGCTSVNGSLPCDRHFRSRLLDSWPSASIDQVRVSLYENGVEKAQVVFSGIGSNFQNWFSANRVMNSSWRDLKTTPSFSVFSLEGDLINKRRFAIAIYNVCNNDQGWMLVKDVATDICSGVVAQHTPTFFYAQSNTAYNWQAHPFREADVLAIFVKLRPNADLDQMCLN